MAVVVRRCRSGAAEAAVYLGRTAESPHEAWSVTVLTVRDDRIAALTSFLGPHHFLAFGLPPALS